MRLDIRNILRQGYTALAPRRRLPARHHKAIAATLSCKTAMTGTHRLACPRGHYSEVRYNSCRHRSCPRCAHRDSEAWLERFRKRLLPCEHFHVVFTVPSELRELWRWNRKEMADLLFSVSRDALFTMLRDPAHLGARPGVVMALHTWGRTLVFHPHVHCLVTGGGLTDGGVWKSVRNGFLLPVRAVRKLYRGRFLARLESMLRAEKLRLPGTLALSDALELLRQAARKPWNVRIEPPYSHGAGLAVYLARYLRGGPIGNSRLQRLDGDGVTFSYRDFRENGEPGSMTLSTLEFTRRWLDHVPIPGQQLVRSFGLYHHSARRWLESCRYQLTAFSSEVASPREGPPRRHSERGRCPTCGAELKITEVAWSRPPVPFPPHGRSPPKATSPG